MLTFNDINWLVVGKDLVGVRVTLGLRPYDISINALKREGLTKDHLKANLKPVKLKEYKEADGSSVYKSSGEALSGVMVEDKSSDGLWVRAVIGAIDEITRTLDPEKLNALRSSQLVNDDEARNLSYLLRHKRRVFKINDGESIEPYVLLNVLIDNRSGRSSTFSIKLESSSGEIVYIKLIDFMASVKSGP